MPAFISQSHDWLALQPKLRLQLKLVLVLGDTRQIGYNSWAVIFEVSFADVDCPIMSSVSVQLPTGDLPAASYPFFANLAKIINSGQARSIVVSGNIYDLYFDGKQYVPLLPFVQSKTQIAGLIQVVYELNCFGRIESRLIVAHSGNGHHQSRWNLSAQDVPRRRRRGGRLAQVCDRSVYSSRWHSKLQAVNLGCHQ